MIMESLVTLMAIVALIILGTLSHALMQDITDPITGRTVRDKEGRRALAPTSSTCAIGWRNVLCRIPQTQTRGAGCFWFAHYAQQNH